MEKHLEIYTDGACSGNPGPGAFGVLILNSKKEIIQRYREFTRETTSNRMELSAVLWVLQNIKADKITLYSDSSYVVKGINEWLKSWKKNYWKTTSGSVKNLDLWQLIDRELGRTKNIYEFYWVKGHNNNYYNEEVDKLARLTIMENI